MTDTAEVALKARPFQTPEDVKRALAHRYKLSVSDLEGPSRKPSTSWVRQLAMALAYKKLRAKGYTFEAIGVAFGGRHYATVIHACRKFGVTADPVRTEYVMRGVANRGRPKIIPPRPVKVVVKPPNRDPEAIKRAYWLREAGFTQRRLAA
jgi:hypothetical protein